MITKQAYLDAQDFEAQRDLRKLIKFIEDKVSYHSLSFQMKASDVKTPWHILVPKLKEHVAQFGWTLEIKDTHVTEGQRDTYSVLYKEFTLS